jgi:2-polyprenyl-3-methyl-5-hydroxy-6-metoxy-1,4-benzoquinol methylase
MQRQGVRFNDHTTVLDLGCGHGLFGLALQLLGCKVVFSDEQKSSQLPAASFRPLNIDRDALASLGTYDVVICSNVYEHLAKPTQFIRAIPELLKPQGYCYLSWTNWLSPWGGHEFSPFHYLGATRGHRVFDRLTQRPRKHTPFVNLYPTYVGDTMRQIRQVAGLRVIKAAPRYYTELSWIMHLPLLRELLAWNAAILLQRD